MSFYYSEITQGCVLYKYDIISRPTSNYKNGTLHCIILVANSWQGFETFLSVIPRCSINKIGCSIYSIYCSFFDRASGIYSRALNKNSLDKPSGFRFCDRSKSSALNIIQINIYTRVIHYLINKKTILFSFINFLSKPLTITANPIRAISALEKRRRREGEKGEKWSAIIYLSIKYKTNIWLHTENDFIIWFQKMTSYYISQLNTN